METKLDLKAISEIRKTKLGSVTKQTLIKLVTPSETPGSVGPSPVLVQFAFRVGSKTGAKKPGQCRRSLASGLHVVLAKGKHATMGFFKSAGEVGQLRANKKHTSSPVSSN